MSSSPGSAGRLAATGRRITAPRLAVLEKLSALPSPFTIEEVTAALPDVGRATVFRTVKLLQESGMVCRMVMEDGAIRYELSGGKHHHHLICGRCGSVTEFEDASLDSGILAASERSRFRLAGHSLELYGTCAECA